jgi:hypothetical protein
MLAYIAPASPLDNNMTDCAAARQQKVYKP